MYTYMQREKAREREGDDEREDQREREREREEKREREKEREKERERERERERETNRERERARALHVINDTLIRVVMYTYQSALILIRTSIHVYTHLSVYVNTQGGEDPYDSLSREQFSAN